MTHPPPNDPDRLSRRQMLFRTASSMAVGGFVTSVAAGTASKSKAGVLDSLKAPNIAKQCASSDYHQSLDAFGGRLTMPIEHLLRSGNSASQNGITPWQYDVVIIGSGYGASVCAARLSQRLRPGGRLAIIERGKEWIPGTFPDRFPAMAKESQRSLFGIDKRTIQNPVGLLNVLQGKDVSVMSACGIGGGSLINANVAIRPDWELFQQSAWPMELNNRAFLDPYFDRAEWELGCNREPIDLSDKMRAQRMAAEMLRDQGAHFEAANLTITRGSQIGLPIMNRQGMMQRPCTSCGDCMTGCNVGAKNTLAMNYLPLARRCGAHIFSETEVEAIEKCDGYYTIHYVHHQRQGNEFVPIRSCVRSRIVILGAGSLGSTEILLRSQSPNLQFSPRLGCSWSGNGDILGFIRGVDPCTNIAGTGAKAQVDKIVGPTIQSTVTFPSRPELFQRVVIQDGVSASAYNLFVSVFGRDIGLDHTQILLISGHDGAQGRIELDEDRRAVIRWPGLYDHPYRKMAENELNRFAAVLGGKYKELASFKGRVGTVHPLGGCGIGNHPGCGVVNHKGQVFDAIHGGDIDPITNQTRVHSGLYVADGAVLPTAVGVNPLLTITALAERTADLISGEPSYQDLFVN